MYVCVHMYAAHGWATAPVGSAAEASKMMKAGTMQPKGQGPPTTKLISPFPQIPLQ